MAQERSWAAVSIRGLYRWLRRMRLHSQYPKTINGAYVAKEDRQISPV